MEEKKSAIFSLPFHNPRVNKDLSQVTKKFTHGKMPTQTATRRHILVFYLLEDEINGTGVIAKEAYGAS